MDLNSLLKASGFVKLVEIVISILFVVLSLGMNGYILVCKSFAIFYGGVMVMALMVTPLLLITHLCGNAKDLQKSLFEVLFSAVMAIFLLVAGCVVVFSNMGQSRTVTMKITLVGSAIFSNTGVYILDTYLSVRDIWRTVKETMRREAEVRAAQREREGHRRV